MFSYFWCQSFHWCPRFRKKDWIRIWIQDSGDYIGRLTPKVWQQKRKAFQIILNIHLIKFWNLPSFDVQNPGSGFWPKPDPNHCLLTSYISEKNRGFLLDQNLHILFQQILHDTAWEIIKNYKKASINKLVPVWWCTRRGGGPTSAGWLGPRRSRGPRCTSLNIKNLFSIVFFNLKIKNHWTDIYILYHCNLQP